MMMIFNRAIYNTANAQIKLATVPLNSGDRLMLYTDGMIELQDSSGKTWGERALLKCLIRCANEQMNLEAMVKEVSDEFTNFRKETGLVDDVTYFFVGR